MTRKPDTRKHGRSRRAVLLTMMALGAVVSLTAANGIFAIFTDRATTGTNTASSRAEAASADLQIAPGTFDNNTTSTTCGTYSEDLVTGVITVTDLTPGGTDDGDGSVCLKNVGSRTVDLTASAIDLVDTDHACTGDEATLDASCGGDEAGELSGQLEIEFLSGCVSSALLENQVSLASLSSAPADLVSLAPDEVICLHIIAFDHASTTGDMITITQSDTATWRFAFDGTAV